MSCNCNSGDTPEYHITLDGVGADGYSPEINIVNEDTKSFELELVNKSNTQNTPAIPKLTYLEGTYVSNSSLASTLANYSTTAQIAATYLSKSDAATTYLKVDGSNAANPITIDGLQIRNNSGYITLGTGTTTTINTQARAINFVETDSNGDQQSLIQMGSTGNINVHAAGTLTLGGSGIRPSYSQAGGTAKSLALLTDMPDITSKLNTDGSNATNPITFGNLSISNSFGNATIDSDTNILNLKGENISVGNDSTSSEVNINGTGGRIRIINNYGVYIYSSTDKDICLMPSGTGRAYYGTGTSTSNEIATKNDINDATITITQGGVTKGTFTLNQSSNATIALDAGGSASTNPIVLKTTDESRSLALGLDNDTKKAYMTYTISTGGIDLPLPVRLIAGKSAPITLTETNEGLTTIGLDYNTDTLGLDANNKLTANIPDISNLANKDLDNLSTDGEQRLHALKGYSDEGEVLTDPEGLADVISYTHSTFDSTKFTATGSPTITTDGIASGFSSSNYLTISNSGTLDKTTYFYIHVVFTTPAAWGTSGGRFWSHGSQNYVGHTTAGKLSGSFLGTAISNSDLSALTLSTKYEAFFIYDESGWYITYREFGGTTWISSTPVEITSETTVSLTTQQIGKEVGSGFAFLGSIDLKYFEFSADSINFKGNKTGTDTLTSGGSTITIPYTLASTGDKIVDAYYRDDVEDLCERDGSALYWTLDEVNENYTLPQGNVYGFLTQLQSVVTDLQSRLTALETNINGGGVGVTQLNMMSMSPLSLRPTLSINRNQNLDIDPDSINSQEGGQDE